MSFTRIIANIIFYASGVLLFLLVVVFLVLVNPPPRDMFFTKPDERAGPRRRRVASQKATAARLLPHTPRRSHAIISDDHELSACFDKLSIEDSVPKIPKNMSIPELDCFDNLSIKDLTPEVATSNPIECFANLSLRMTSPLKEISPRIARTIQSMASCQISSPSSSATSLDTVIASFDSLSVADADMMDYEMTSASTKSVVAEPPKVLRSCFKSSNTLPTAKKSVTFNDLKTCPFVTRSEVIYFKPDRPRKRPFEPFSPEKRIEVYLSSSNYPHEFGKVIYEERDDKVFMLKALGTFYEPNMVGKFIPKPFPPDVFT